MIHYYHAYVPVRDAALFTVVLLPNGEGTYPTVLMRSPYVDSLEEKKEGEICALYAEEHHALLENGYAVVFQHCRGRGKSTGDCIPYIFEREDGLALQAWVREQPFYNGELYLAGGSYTSSVHFCTAPFAPDIKGAVLRVQDCERYNCNYRNGFYKMGLHGGWYVSMYKRKSIREKNYTKEHFRLLPLSDFSKTVFGEHAEDFDEILRHPRRDDPFWQTRFGGGEAHDAIKNANIPILLLTGFYDIYTGGVFDMWRSLDEATRKKSALVVHPYAHSGRAEDQPVAFEGGRVRETFGDYDCRFLNFVRGKEAAPFPTGKVTYYPLFEDGWRCDDFFDATHELTLPLGEGERTYCYDPKDPPSFKGGLSANFGGTAYQDPPNSRPDIVSLYTEPFRADTPIKGRMRARLVVRSDREDTCFYVRVSLARAEGDYGLRDDITQISNVVADYRPGDTVALEFSFDEHAFCIKKGERLRVDIASAAEPFYVRHTNNRGLFSEQTETRVAKNTVLLRESDLTLPIE